MLIRSGKTQSMMGARKNATADFGGIDLTQQDSAMHIERDANGGVKISVDPAVIARVEREGVSRLDPVFINMRPLDVGVL
jgi:hypothetical protein